MEEREVSPNSRRPTFAMLGAVCGALGAVIRKLKVGLFISRDGLGGKYSHSAHGGDAFATSVRCKRSSLEPGAAPQVSFTHGQSAQ